MDTCYLVLLSQGQILIQKEEKGDPDDLHDKMHLVFNSYRTGENCWGVIKKGNLLWLYDTRGERQMLFNLDNLMHLKSLEKKIQQMEELESSEKIIEILKQVGQG